MIYQDGAKFPTDGYSRDYMDSSVRAGVMSICNYENTPDLMNYVLYNGEFIRGPVSTNARNPKNYSRDQLLCLVAGLSKFEEGRTAIRKNLYNRIKGFFTCQNTERDLPGSTKYKKTHYFYRDSHPSVLTVFNKEELDPKYAYKVEKKTFDMADILLPHHIWHMILASKTYWLYPFAIIGIPVFILDLLIRPHLDHYEENQFISMCYVQGSWATKLYRSVHTKWESISEKYWRDREEIEYHEMLVKLVEGA